MKKLAARDFEDMLQVIIYIVFFTLLADFGLLESVCYPSLRRSPSRTAQQFHPPFNIYLCALACYGQASHAYRPYS
jgi:hypothetical protein